MPAQDPWLWTVDDLIAEICHSGALFQAAGCEVGNLPDSALLEHQLRSQQITGSVFLTGFNSRALGHLGQRVALASVIEVLRQQSFLYKHVTFTDVEPLITSNTDPLSSPCPPRASCEADIMDETGRKRRKTAHFVTTPSSAIPIDILVVPEQTSVTGAWDYLRRWEDLADEGEEEADFAADTEFEREDQGSPRDAAEEVPQDVSDEEDRPELGQPRSRMSQDQVVEIINERIELYTNSWKPNKGVTKGEEIEYDPLSMWEKAEASGQRDQSVQKYEEDLAYYTQRLDNLCETIVKDPGNTTDKVRRQCSNLEVTIDSMELARWLVSIFALEPVGDDDAEPDIGNPDGLDPKLPARAWKLPEEIIDLGSPSESSASDQDDLLPKRRSADLDGKHHSANGQLSSPSLAVTAIIGLPIHQQASMYSNAPLSHPQAGHGDEPEQASIASVRRWRWLDLVGTQDRKRVVSKVVSVMDAENRETIRSRLKYVGRKDMSREIPACIKMLSTGGSKIHGVLSRDLEKIVILTRLFLSWWLCDNYFREEPSKWRLEELRKCLDEGCPDTTTFFDYLCTILATTFSLEALRNPELPLPAEIIEISDDDDTGPRPPPANRHKTATNKNQGVQNGPAIVID